MVKIGTSGFSFPDWKGTVYPKRLPNKEMLSYYTYTLRFDTVEINFTYYALPSPKNFEIMSRKVPEDFEFVVKGYKGITHDPFDKRLETIPTKEDIEKSFHAFYDALTPMRNSNKLGAVLLQFPVFFSHNQKNRDYILFCKDQLKDIRVVIEFRNKDWANDETFCFLRENNLGYCAVDEPKLPRLMPFINEVTSSLGYMRFHGRNPHWFNTPASERYNYLYSDEELKEFVPEAEKMDSTKAQKVYTFFNNCHAGFALRNALAFKRMVGLGGKDLEGILPNDRVSDSFFRK
ncbi:MAG: DUF72 domain-containing protein [Nitrospirota bacterium]|nr:DUF72 domain-containing protein [Nitrospirota bacterium]MDH5767561.1 DUF72 domain-containing protein [Nitrospirota bacterium]